MTFEGDGCPPVIDGHRSRMRRVAKIALPTAAALGTGAFVASAAIPAADGSITACYANGVQGGPAKGTQLRLVDSSADCGQNETAITWNQKGPSGPQGTQGSQGPAGANGVNGQNGAGGAVGASVFPRAATDYLLEIDGIKGESSDAKHKDTIQIESFSWGATNAGAKSSGGGGGAGKVRFHDISIKKPVDASSPKLFLACATGQHIKKAVLYVRKAGGQPLEYMKITLTDVLVSSYNVGSQQPKGPGEVESVTLNFTKIEQTYIKQNPDGSAGSPTTAGYDVKANKKL